MDRLQLVSRVTKRDFRFIVENVLESLTAACDSWHIVSGVDATGAIRQTADSG